MQSEGKTLFAMLTCNNALYFSGWEIFVREQSSTISCATCLDHTFGYRPTYIAPVHRPHFFMQSRCHGLGSLSERVRTYHE